MYTRLRIRDVCIPMVMIYSRCAYDGDKTQPAGDRDHRRDGDEARARLSHASLHVARVFRHEGANVGRRARFRPRDAGGRRRGGGGAPMREDDDGAGARAGAKPLGSPRSRAGVEGEVARARARERCGDARAVSIGSNETFRWIRAMRGRGRWRARDEDGDDGRAAMRWMSATTDAMIFASFARA